MKVKYPHDANVRGCYGKHRYLDIGKASKAAARLAREENADVSAYYCTVCDYWHVGNSTKRKRDKLEQGRSLSPKWEKWKNAGY